MNATKVFNSLLPDIYREPNRLGKDLIAAKVLSGDRITAGDKNLEMVQANKKLFNFRTNHNISVDNLSKNFKVQGKKADNKKRSAVPTELNCKTDISGKVETNPGQMKVIPSPAPIHYIAIR